MAGGWKEYEVSPEVLVQARRLGLFGNVEKRIARMARKSAPLTHPAGNRRFEHFILKIEKGVVVSIKKFDPDTGAVITDAMKELENHYPPVREPCPKPQT